MLNENDDESFETTDELAFNDLNVRQDANRQWRDRVLAQERNGVSFNDQFLREMHWLRYGKCGVGYCRNLLSVEMKTRRWKWYFQGMPEICIVCVV
jgi:hypothetical protein